MLRLIFLTSFFSLLVVGSVAQEISKEEALEDVEQLKTNLLRFHPGVHRYTPTDSVDYYFDLVVSRLADEMPMADFYKEITFLLNKIRCGHTRPMMSSWVNRTFKRGRLFLPLAVRYLGKRLYIENSRINEANLKKGEEILDINGKSVSSITKLIFEHHSADGFISSSKYRLTERYFRLFYQLYVDTNASSYVLKIRSLDGSIRQVTIAGGAYDDLEALDSPVPEEAELRLEHREDYSYMRIGIFDSPTMEEAGLDFEEFLKDSFWELKDRRVKKLILDLRGNGGGDDVYGALLTTYFANTAFQYFERIEVTDKYSGYGKVRRSRGRNLMISHPAQKLWKPQKNRFKGELYVLTDGWSFSTCADVATILHDNRWATFLGEETGGGYDGNTSGISKELRLRNSDIEINLPMWMYTTATAGEHRRGRGVIPDYPVIPDVQQFINGEDAVLKQAESLIQKN